MQTSLPQVSPSVFNSDWRSAKKALVRNVSKALSQRTQENFAENPWILLTKFKVLSTSCCLCYRRQNVSNLTISLSFKMKFMTGVLSLLSLLRISKSLFACKWMMRRKHKMKHLFWSQFTFTENPSKTRFPCARSLWCCICFRFTCQSVITHSRLRKTRSK